MREVAITSDHGVSSCGLHWLLRKSQQEEFSTRHQLLVILTSRVPIHAVSSRWKHAKVAAAHGHERSRAPLWPRRRRGGKITFFTFVRLWKIYWALLKEVRLTFAFLGLENDPSTWHVNAINQNYFTIPYFDILISWYEYLRLTQNFIMLHSQSSWIETYNERKGTYVSFQVR